MDVNTISTYISLGEQIFGSTIGKALLGLFQKEGGLTDEQKANLDANHEDYLRRIARRDVEGG